VIASTRWRRVDLLHLLNAHGVRCHVLPELVVPVEEDDPMLGQLWELLPDDDVPDDVVPLDVVVVVVVAANDAYPSASKVAAAKTARTVMRTRARLLGNERTLGEGTGLNSISFLFTSRHLTLYSKRANIEFPRCFPNRS
jgi:hypothetical protein